MGYLVLILVGAILATVFIGASAAFDLLFAKLVLPFVVLIALVVLTVIAVVAAAIGMVGLDKARAWLRATGRSVPPGSNHSLIDT